MKVHFIQHDSWLMPGEYLAWAARNRHEVSMTRCWLYESVPESVDADMLILLGGLHGPSDTKAECDYFDSAKEKDLIRDYVDSGKIVIGVCLGTQLIGEALGAAYSLSPEREIGPTELRLTAAGKADPYFAAFPPAFHAGEWHSDMAGLTKSSVVLAESAGCPRQIMRYGRFVYGLQAHLEFNREIVAAGIAAAGDSLKTEGRFVQTEEQMLAFDYTEMNALLSGFLDAITEDYRHSKELESRKR